MDKCLSFSIMVGIIDLEMEWPRMCVVFVIVLMLFNNKSMIHFLQFY